MCLAEWAGGMAGWAAALAAAACASPFLPARLPYRSMLKKLKKGRISQHQYDVAIGASSDDEDDAGGSRARQADLSSEGDDSDGSDAGRTPGKERRMCARQRVEQCLQAGEWAAGAGFSAAQEWDGCRCTLQEVARRRRPAAAVLRGARRTATAVKRTTRRTRTRGQRAGWQPQQTHRRASVLLMARAVTRSRRAAQATRRRARGELPGAPQGAGGRAARRVDAGEAGAQGWRQGRQHCSLTSTRRRARRSASSGSTRARARTASEAARSGARGRRVQCRGCAR
jgi:hypothetical protein